MVVGMRRTTRVFGVVKSGDGARILRSGRKLYSDPSDVVTKSKKSCRVEWLKNSDEDEGSKVATGLCGKSQVSDEKAEARAEFKNEVCDFVAGLERASGMEIVRVYQRKRKRVDCDAKPDGLSGDEKCCGVGKIFGSQFVCRQQMRMTVDVSSACRPGLVVKCTSHSHNSVGLLPRLLNSILTYTMKHRMRLSKLHGFLCSNPLVSVFESQGIRFLQNCSGSGGSGFCKIYGVTQFAPLFSVNFSAIPTWFIYVHSSMFLQSDILACTYLVNRSIKTDIEVLDDGDETIVYITSGDHISGNNDRSHDVNNIPKRKLVHRGMEGGDDFHKRKLVHRGIEGGDDFRKRKLIHRHQMRLRSSFSSSKIKGKRTAPRSKRSRRMLVGDDFHKSSSFFSVSGMQKTNNVCKLWESPVADLSCMRLNVGHSIGILEKVQDSSSGWSSSDSLSSPFSIKREWRAGPNEFVSNEVTKNSSASPRMITVSTSCAANILVTDHDKCYRVEGASVMLEPSHSNRWLLFAKKDGFTKYTHMAEMVMKPCTFNRATHNIIWTVNNDWKLEFPTRDDWAIFKELYKMCSSKNLEAPSAKIIPVPGVHIVSNYEDTNSILYSRPEAYISLDGSEVSRVLAKTSASYDIDSEDENWLASYNEEIHSLNGSHKTISSDTLEVIIDAIEKALYYSPGDYLDEMSMADICPELVHDGFVKVVYTYWSKKRTKKSPNLVRVLRAYKPRQVLDVRGPVMRKKRSFNRYASQNGRGKQRFLLEDNVGEEFSLMEVEEATVSASRYIEWATYQRKRAQALMEYADLATYKSAIAIKVAQAAKDATEPCTAASMILM